MKLFNATHCATLLITLGSTLPLSAAHAGADGNRSTGAKADGAQIAAQASSIDPAPSEAKKNGGVKFTLVCGGGSCGRANSGYGGYGGYRPPMVSAPAYRPQMMAAPVSQPVAYAPPAPAAAPVAAAPPAPALPNAVIVLSNPQEDTVAYTLNGSRYDMQPRHSQKLTTSPSWVLEFDRGGSFGTARYTLNQGNYKFVATDRGWDLVKDADRPAPPAPSFDYSSYAGGR